ncbi:MAG TPA: SDR family NAD(P)-dependent oxidoreductase [Thermoflexales bacterium]|nr:SDR family NAD(P)-dependent oxidoreductase [Thermoflexales bacterium]
MSIDTPQGIALITGGNRGIGYATALSLAKRNTPIIFTSRDASRGQASADTIRALVPGARVEVLSLDLASMASIRAFAAAFLIRDTPLRALINNAGAMGLGKQIEFTRDGFEMEFGTNHLGHFLLTHLLMPALEATPGSRVISVASIRHIPGKGGIGARFDFDNLKGEKSYEPRMSYNNTKLANVWFAYELQRRFGGKGLVSIAACPGFVPETLAVSRTGLAHFVYTRLLPLIPGARPAAVSGDELSALAIDPAYAKEGGTFYASGKKIASSPASYDEASARRLWELSEKLTGVGSA